MRRRRCVSSERRTTSKWAPPNLKSGKRISYRRKRQIQTLRKFAGCLTRSNGLTKRTMISYRSSSLFVWSLHDTWTPLGTGISYSHYDEDDSNDKKIDYFPLEHPTVDGTTFIAVNHSVENNTWYWFFRIDALSKELASAQQFATDVSTENQELREQLQQLKEMCRREAETAEATIRQQEDTIFEYKKICGRLQEVNQAIQADRNRNKRKQNGEDTQVR